MTTLEKLANMPRLSADEDWNDQFDKIVKEAKRNEKEDKVHFNTLKTEKK